MTPQWSPTTLAGIAQSLGRMAAQIEGLQQDIGEVKESAAARTLKIDRIPVIEQELAGLRNEVRDVLAAVEDHERLKQRLIGWLIGTAGAGGVLGAFADRLIAMLGS